MEKEFKIVVQDSKKGFIILNTFLVRKIREIKIEVNSEWIHPYRLVIKFTDETEDVLHEQFKTFNQVIGWMEINVKEEWK